MNYQMVYQNNFSVMLLLTKCKEAIRVQDYDSGIRRFREFLFYFQKTLEELIKNQSTLLQEGIQVESTYEGCLQNCWKHKKKMIIFFWQTISN